MTDRHIKNCMVRTTCQQCGREFEVERCEVRKGWGKFCSRKCAVAATVKYPLVEWNGKTYCYHPPTGYYYSSTTRPKTLLHRDIWEYHHGPIPKGMDVHHRDRNRTHNVIENLELIDHAEHARRYPGHKPKIKSITCRYCGRVVTSAEKRLRKTTKYCSPECARQAMRSPVQLAMSEEVA